MTYELALIAVVIVAGYWGVIFVRQQPHGTATFGLMQLAAAGLAGLGLLGQRYEADALGMTGSCRTIAVVGEPRIRSWVADSRARIERPGTAA